MNFPYSAKLIQHLLNKEDDHGFTIIELLVLIIVIGILAAISLPSFMSCGNKAVLSEARTYVGSMNRAQQAYFLENQDKFSSSLSQLEIGIPEQTDNYSYSTKSTTNAAFNYGIARNDYVNVSWFNKKEVISFVGAVFQKSTKNKGEIETLDILCINDKPGKIIPPDPIFKNGLASCAQGTTEIK